MVFQVSFFSQLDDHFTVECREHFEKSYIDSLPADASAGIKTLELKALYAIHISVYSLIYADSH